MSIPKPGENAPNFEAKDQDEKIRKLSDYQGKKLVLYFYPKADTPGCTKESCNLRDHYKALQNAGYEVLGVSADSPKRQRNFKEKYNFPFPLLADEDKAIIKAYGVWGIKKRTKKEGIRRMTFLIDENGKIEKVIDKVNTNAHAAQIV